MYMPVGCFLFVGDYVREQWRHQKFVQRWGDKYSEIRLQFHRKRRLLKKNFIMKNLLIFLLLEKSMKHWFYKSHVWIVEDSIKNWQHHISQLETIHSFDWLTHTTPTKTTHLFFTDKRQYVGHTAQRMSVNADILNSRMIRVVLTNVFESVTNDVNLQLLMLSA